MNPSKNALTRLHRILSDETYGPALVRLPKPQQRTVLDLIDRNEGARARQEILRLDRERRESGTEEREYRRQRQVFTHIVAELRGQRVEYSETTISSGVAMMTRTEYTETMSMDGSTIREVAGYRNYIRYAPLLDHFRNPWWYH